MFYKINFFSFFLIDFISKSIKCLNNYGSFFCSLEILWLKTSSQNNEYKTSKFHNKIKSDNALIYNCKNPGKIIAFIL